MFTEKFSTLFGLNASRESGSSGYLMPVLERIKLLRLKYQAADEERMLAEILMEVAAGSAPDQDKVGVAVSAPVTVTEGAGSALLRSKL